MADKYIDPRHFMPPYVVDLRNEPEPNDFYTAEDFLLNEQFVLPEETVGDENQVPLEVPTSFDVVAQYVRPQKDGTFLVDVEIELPDVENATDFDIRTAVIT